MVCVLSDSFGGPEAGVLRLWERAVAAPDGFAESVAVRKLKRTGWEAFTDRYQGLMHYYYGMEVAGPRSRLGSRLPAPICQAPALQAGPDSAFSDRLPNTMPWSRSHAYPRNAISVQLHKLRCRKASAFRLVIR